MDNITRDMKLNEVDGIQFFTFKDFEKYPEIKHAFSTRKGGVSLGVYESLNLAYGRGDPDSNVEENYNKICEALEILPESLVFSNQDHNLNIRRVNQFDRGEGIFKEKKYKSIDGLITDCKDVTLVTHYADCVPLYFYDPKISAIGMAHAGWKGTLGRIGARMVDEFIREFGSNPEDIIVGIGPAIGPCCFEVSKDVWEKFTVLNELKEKEWYDEKADEKYNMNLWEINKQILIFAGIKEENISTAGLCTCCFNEIFFSHRASKGQRGGLAGFITIANSN